MTEKSVDDVRFFGKVTASVSHDLQNVIAVIKESAGLMEDILLMNRDNEIPFFDKFQKSLSIIKNQTIRGSSLIKSLNDFAHAPDHVEKEVDITKTAWMIATLIERKTKSSNILIHVEAPGSPCFINTNEVRLEMALLAAIENMMFSLPKGSTISITPEKRAGELIIGIACKELTVTQGVSAIGAEGMASLEELLQTINGHAEPHGQFRGICLRFNSKK